MLWHRHERIAFLLLVRESPSRPHIAHPAERRVFHRLLLRSDGVQKEGSPEGVGEEGGLMGHLSDLTVHPTPLGPRLNLAAELVATVARSAWSLSRCPPECPEIRHDLREMPPSDSIA